MITIDNINEFIREENGEEINIDSFLLDSNLDSFSFLTFWVKVSGICPKVDSVYFTKIDYVTYSIKELMEFCNDS